LTAIGGFARQALLCAILATCLTAFAQSPGRVYRIGWFDSTPVSAVVQKTMLDELSRLGFVEGKNLSIQRTPATPKRDELEGRARELIATRPDVLMTHGTVNTRILQSLTSRIPIVFIGAADPVESGLVKSLAQPGGNTTGVSNVQCAINYKLLELARAVVPQATRVSLVMEGSPETYPCVASLAGLRSQPGIDIVWVDAYKGDPAALAAANSLAHARPDVVILQTSPAQAKTIIKSLAEAKGRRIPIVSGRSDDGAAAWLNIDVREVARLSANQVARILAGASPASLPVALSSRYRNEVDLHAARDQGVHIPESVLLRADRVIPAEGGTPPFAR